ncbi:MAG: radical SAM protein [Dehalococcoidia bacterium]|nr:radical SAM protein [Dehalococcoidia bacterium]MDD5494337.1 radical SAM protein [Dehalococcoidia bacterium]
MKPSSKYFSQIKLFDNGSNRYSLPSDYEPVRPDFLDINHIYLAKGSISTPERKRFVERVCSLYPDVTITECLETPHNRINLNVTGELNLHQAGKKSLVFGELGNAVRFSEEKGNTCPNYWHFSPYGFCPYGCKYCYLAGTQGVKLSPTVKIFINLPEILAQVNDIANQFNKPTAFFLGKLQDALALDPLTAYSSKLIPFFAMHPIARMTLLTKSTNIDHLVRINHNGHTIFSWSVNPPEVCDIFEENVPSTEDRLQAMYRVAAAGYRVRGMLMPLIPIDGWEHIYSRFIEHLLTAVPLERLTIGGICIYSAARKIMEHKMELHNAISVNVESKTRQQGDGRVRYTEALRVNMYSLIIKTVRKIKPDLGLALCMEDQHIWLKLGLEDNIGRCNCVL